MSERDVLRLWQVHDASGVSQVTEYWNGLVIRSWPDKCRVIRAAVPDDWLDFHDP